jgi:hypothetical protein
LEEKLLRKVSIVVAIVAAMVSISAVAFAQANGNIYGVTGKIASGGTKKKPKHVGLSFNYTVKTADGTLSTPVATYKIHFQGLKFNAKGVAGGKYCSAKTINDATTDSGCPKGTHVGTGKVNALVGSAGQPVNPTSKCNLNLDIYVGSAKSLTLYLHGNPPDCIAQISQAIDAKLSTDATGGALTFTVPGTPLLHPAPQLDTGITSVSSTIVKGSGNKGLFTSIGCKGTRKIDVTFTTEDGTTGTASNSAGKC